MKIALLALASILLSVAAQFVLKHGVATRADAPVSGAAGWLAMLLEPAVIAGLGLYALGAVVWLQVLSQWDVSRAYPLVGFGFVLTAAVGYLLGEQIGLQRLAGVALICTGVLLVGRS